VILKYIEETEDLSPEEQKALDMLKNWDNNYDKDKIAPLIFEEFYLILSKNIIEDEIGEDLLKEFQHTDLLTNYLIDNTIKKGGSSWCDDVNTKDKTETLKDMVQKSFKELIPEFKKRTGKIITETQWGEVHKLDLKHPLGKVKMLDIAFNLNRLPAVGGSYHTVSPYSYVFKNPYYANHGASHRHIYDMSDLDNSFSIIPTGVSGIPSSKHYCDQTDMYIKGEYHADYTSIDKVKKNAVYTAVFTPYEN
ncbi:MAG: penicillin acylase family protein, partial [Chlorobi bacterium]|nr:penicillin acylase family protein [Chlorobiota bacterium]